ncbi:hypothetical protein, partial [Candidatus Borrarchaeum sp.]|uniref:hypothetical protein n=1 Tax=Candidatus Borrarchaeum sp. TaxID=2846742 RepID=UPI0025809245
MVNNTRQLVFKGGDMCRFAFFDSAIQSAPHRITAVHSTILSIYRGGIDKKSHNSSRLFQPTR